MFQRVANLFAAAFCLGLSGAFLYLTAISPAYPCDYVAFLRSAAGGGFEGFYYLSYFLLPVKPLTTLPLPVSFLLWNGLNILGFIAAARHFGGKIWVGLLSYPMLYNLYYGNIGGLLAFGAMLLHKGGWWGGLGAAIVLVKPQVGLLLVLVTLIRGHRLKTLLPLAGCMLAGFLVYGWVLPLDRILASPPVTAGSISLWEVIGVGAVLAFVPLLWRRDLRTASAANALGQPYYQVTGMLPLLAMERGYLGLLTYIGFLMPFGGWLMIDLIAIFPLVVLLTNHLHLRVFRPAAAKAEQLTPELSDGAG